MENQTEIKIYATDDVARKFLVFQQYFDPISTIIDAHVFDVRNGSVVLNFDNLGILQTIQRADTLYSRKHVKISTHY